MRDAEDADPTMSAGPYRPGDDANGRLLPVAGTVP
jgi:hypothetical protein